MSHLQHNVDTGHLLHNASGHLVSTCSDPCPYCLGGREQDILTAVISGMDSQSCEGLTVHLMPNGVFSLNRNDWWYEGVDKNCFWTDVISDALESPDYIFDLLLRYRVYSSGGRVYCSFNINIGFANFETRYFDVADDPASLFGSCDIGGDEMFSAFELCDCPIISSKYFENSVSVEYQLLGGGNATIS